MPAARLTGSQRLKKRVGRGCGFADVNKRQFWLLCFFLLFFLINLAGLHLLFLLKLIFRLEIWVDFRLDFRLDFWFEFWLKFWLKFWLYFWLYFWLNFRLDFWLNFRLFVTEMIKKNRFKNYFSI